MGGRAGAAVLLVEIGKVLAGSAEAVSASRPAALRAICGRPAAAGRGRLRAAPRRMCSAGLAPCYEASSSILGDCVWKFEHAEHRTSRSARTQTDA